MSIKRVRLKTGVEAAEPLVRAAMVSLERLFAEDGGLFFELVTKAREPDYQFFGDSAPLKERALLNSRGHVHHAVREVILAAVTGEGIAMTLGSPLAPEPPAKAAPGGARQDTSAASPAGAPSPAEGGPQAAAPVCTCDAWYAPPEARRRCAPGCPAGEAAGAVPLQPAAPGGPQ